MSKPDFPRIITLSVEVEEPEYTEYHQRMAMCQLGMTKTIWASLSHSHYESDPSSDIEDGDLLYTDENTIPKVYQVLVGAGIDNNQAMGIINEMANHGLLFRERR